MPASDSADDTACAREIEGMVYGAHRIEFVEPTFQQLAKHNAKHVSADKKKQQIRRKMKSI